jgi:hypothetical protein
MKIYSKFKDYYDAIGAGDLEKTPIYKRDTVEEGLNEIDYKDLQVGMLNHFEPNGDVKVSSYIIGFCGKIYPYWKVSTKTKSTGFYNDRIEKIIYDPQELLSIDFERKDYKWMAKYYPNKFNARNSLKNPQEYIDYLNNHKPLTDIFLQMKIPIFFLRRARYSEKKFVYVIEKNPSLKEHEFAKMIDPYTAYQELDMFMGNVLTTDQYNQVDIPTGDDKTLAECKGFNKFSFRKDKGTKLRKGKLKKHRKHKDE